MSRQAEYYRRNREKISAANRAKYRAIHPQAHPWKSAQIVLVPAKNDVEKMLDQLEKERRNFSSW